MRWQQNRESRTRVCAGGASTGSDFTATALGTDDATGSGAAAADGAAAALEAFGFTTCRGGRGGGAFLRGAGARSREADDQA